MRRLIRRFMERFFPGRVCMCISYHERTGEHAEDCPLYRKAIMEVEK